MAARPTWVERALAGRVVDIDVGALLAAGTSPYMPIMGAVDRAGLDGALVLVAPFDPLPIRHALSGKNVTCFAEVIGGGQWRVVCRAGTHDGAPPPQFGESLGAKVWRDGDRAHIDVRGLPPPEPARAILGLIDRPDAPADVVAHLDRDPIFLYPELEVRGWEASMIPSEAGVVRLRLTAPKT